MFDDINDVLSSIETMLNYVPVRHLPLKQGGVYMRKLAPARVSYREDFFISYSVYMMTGSFVGTLHVDKIHV